MSIKYRFVWDKFFSVFLALEKRIAFRLDCYWSFFLQWRSKGKFISLFPLFIFSFFSFHKFILFNANINRYKRDKQSNITKTYCSRIDLPKRSKTTKRLLCYTWWAWCFWKVKNKFKKNIFLFVCSVDSLVFLLWNRWGKLLLLKRL